MAGFIPLRKIDIPAIVVHAGNGDDTIILEGTAEIVTDSAELNRLNEQYMQKYVDPGSGAQATIPGGPDTICLSCERPAHYSVGIR